MTKVILTVSGKELDIDDSHPNLLAALEAKQIPVEYQCREGYCGSCRCKLLKGEVEWVSSPLGFINKDEILPCCVKPKGEIEVNL